MSTSTLPDAVAVTGLTKRYGRRTVVDDVSVRIPSGSVTGLIGPNGAGKTTVMSMLLGLVRPTSGEGQVLGHDLARPKAYVGRVGALIEGPAFHPSMSGRANLRNLVRLGRHDPEQIAPLLHLVGLADRGDDLYGAYSLGMKQRLGIAAALLGDPDLVILDEPTNGVDPQGMRDIRHLVRRIAEGGRTVLVSSHLLAELEHVCDHLVVIDRGGLRYQGPMDELPTGRREVIRVAADGAATDLHDLLVRDGLEATARGTVTEVEIGEADPVRLAARINSTAHAAGITLTELHHQRQTLEDRVLELVGNGSAS
ncbi:ATP-binding cassette domain-containing protein [Luteipulveratus sp. YIM 133132]|uniref:ATP-binding cassette domain-containing protein n=1 Tax=Luteipulveratus flavus TaxID=3031728 RepID=A0ABT6C4K1_9MICO|nr:MULTISPECIES: ATP-binding cassette domain-containing protein [unclassified Luteipulveratus]MDE9367825.1 ATP-binding cassette domain-containing protein [Luteipulveratus sp. YIM 133132]MDF8263753.1 ATP-binding cassette domain-containing protein [Luteipulveratus sp. YIM 133296]